MTPNIATNGNVAIVRSKCSHSRWETAGCLGLKLAELGHGERGGNIRDDLCGSVQIGKWVSKGGRQWGQARGREVAVS